MVNRCPNPACRSPYEASAWHCARCGTPLDAEAVQPPAVDEDRIGPATLAIIILSVALGLVLVAGAIYGTVVNVQPLPLIEP